MLWRARVSAPRCPLKVRRRIRPLDPTGGWKFHQWQGVRLFSRQLDRGYHLAAILVELIDFAPYES